jgi:NAD(P)H dehydrogenase (quinone)
MAVWWRFDGESGVLMRIAVTGAGGRLGGQVVDLLAAEDDHDVVAVSRRKPPYERVTTMVADYADPAALHAALRDVDTLVFVTSDGETAQLLMHHHNVIEAAVAGGVTHIVLLSSLDADLDSPFCYAVTGRYTEQLLDGTECSVSIVRASIYTEFFMRWLTQARTTGQIRLPAADGRISLVSRTDVGRCLAALALTPPTGRTHDLTGPESLDLPAIAAVAEQVWRIPIRYVDLTPAEYTVEMARAGEDPWWMYAFSSMFASVREQRWTPTSGEVARLTGRNPTPLRDILAHPIG